jgi:quercetin dioxygenase-like cupin family protein
VFIQRATESDARVTVLSLGDGLFIPAGEKHKHKAKVLTDVVRIILVEDV